MFIILIYFIYLLVYCINVALCNELITYKVLGIQMLPNDKSMAVLVDGNYFPLKKTSVPMLYTGLAPKSQNSYQYTVIKAGDQSVVSVEEFKRPSEYLTEKASFNDVYGQQWHKIEDMHPLPQLYSFEKNQSSTEGGMNDPAASNLYEEGTVATIHISAPADEVEEMHENKMDKTKSLKATMTFIK